MRGKLKRAVKQGVAVEDNVGLGAWTRCQEEKTVLCAYRLAEKERVGIEVGGDPYTYAAVEVRHPDSENAEKVVADGHHGAHLDSGFRVGHPWMRLPMTAIIARYPCNIYIYILCKNA